MTALLAALLASIGAAPLRAMSQATSLIVDSTDSTAERNALSAEYRLQLQHVEVATARWARQGAGIGRADRLLQAKAAVDLADVVTERSVGA